MIVKLQVPLKCYGGVEPEALLYDEKKLFYEQMPITNDIRTLMDGRYKAFFNVMLRNGTVHFIEEVPDPGW